MSNSQDIRHLVGVATRRKWWVITCSAVGVLAAMVALMVITPRFEATTTVMVEPQRVPNDYVKSTITQRLEDRLKTLEQQITSPDVLTRVIEEADLYPELRGEIAPERLVRRAAKDLEIHVSKGSIFSVTFRGEDRQAVAAAANRIAELFIEENLRRRETQAEGTTQFLQSELEETERQLEVQEKLVSDYRLRNAGSLPDQQATNLALLSQLDKRLDIIRGELEEAQLRKAVLEREAVQLTPSGEIVTAPSESPEAERLEQLQLELVELQTQFTDEHPDVIRKQAEIAQVQSRLGVRAPVEDLSEAPVKGQPSSNSELAELEIEIQQLEAARERNLRDTAAVQRRLEQTPVVEQGLIALTRDYDNLKRSYQELLAKQLEAKLAENLEKKQQAEQFRILQRANVPIAPYYPDRLQFAFLGLGLGLSAGLGLALLRDRLDESIDSLGHLRRDFPAVAFTIAIPVIEVGQDQSSSGKAKDGKLRRLA